MVKTAIFLPNLSRCSGGAEVYGIYLGKAISRYSNVVIITSKSVDNESFDIGKIYEKYGLDSHKFETIYTNTVLLSSNEIKGHKLKAFMHEMFMSFETNYLLVKYRITLFVNCTQLKLPCLTCGRAINIVHFPPKPYSHKLLAWLNSLYVNSYNLTCCNSQFTKYHLKQIYRKNSVVLYPPIVVPMIKKSELCKKEKIILAVGRIVSDKMIMEMVTAFKRLYADTMTDYKFVIVGNKDDSELNYYDKIVSQIKGFAIEIHSDVSFDELLDWYKRATIFWHAKGYNVPENDPESMEHFGMTTVEAMSNGCVPVVVNKAGQREIMSNGLEFLAWTELDELVRITKELIKDEDRIKDLQPIVIKKAQKYQYSAFKKRVSKIMERFV